VYVERLRVFDETEYYPGCSFDLAERFPSIDERKFWATIFNDVARAIFLRRIGEHDVTFWQTSAIGDAYIVARLLTRSVQENEPGWHPPTENTLEAQAFRSGPVAVKV
jgi:hypothetical protein